MKSSQHLRPEKDGVFTEQLHFLQRWVANPRAVGAIAPSGHALSRAMVDQIDFTGGGPVLELGPGPGAITRELLTRNLAPNRLTVIERDPHFAAQIGERFPGIHVIQGDALDLKMTLGQAHEPFAAIISGLPLLNFALDMRRVLLEGVFDRLRPGAPFIQFSYGLHAPAIPPSHVTLTMAAFVWKNLPPARVWVYRTR